MRFTTKLRKLEKAFNENGFTTKVHYRDYSIEVFLFGEKQAEITCYDDEITTNVTVRDTQANNRLSFIPFEIVLNNIGNN